MECKKQLKTNLSGGQIKVTKTIQLKQALILVLKTSNDCGSVQKAKSFMTIVSRQKFLSFSHPLQEQLLVSPVITLFQPYRHEWE